VNYAVEAMRFTASLRFAEFALENWQMKARYRVLRKPAGRAGQKGRSSIYEFE